MLTEEEVTWNVAMGQVHILVEYSFGRVLQEWPFLNAGWKHQLLGNAISCFYIVGVLLINALSYLSPNSTSQRYGCALLHLEEYFHVQAD